MRLDNHYDVFALPCEGDYLVYAPLVGKVLRVNVGCLRQLQDYLRTGDSHRIDHEIIEAMGGLDWMTASPAPAPLPIDRHFHPSGVTLFLTNRCNLRCAYCYAEAGDFDPLEMPEHIYKAAIDFVFRNAQRAGVPLHVGFHGGGEPTRAWKTLVGAMAYARSVNDTWGRPPVQFGLATNGVMSEEQARYVATEFPTVTLSLDGPADIQNAQRPLAGGGGSYDAVMSFVQTLRERRTTLVIRSTVTGTNVERMTEMVDFFAEHTGAKVLHFEPAFLSGRCRMIQSGIPAPDVFAANFIRAWDRARERGINLRFSALRMMGAFLSFCGCSQDAFNVTPHGDVTACFEVCQPEDPQASTFYFGRYDDQRGDYRFDRQRLAHLRSLNVAERPLCRKCFAKWNCAGDCPAKVSRFDDPGAQMTGRCEMIQTITKALLERSLGNGHGLTPQRNLSHTP